MENAKITIELNNGNVTFDSCTGWNTSAGVSRLISEKSELQVKYDRLLKDYELARHECKQKTAYIKALQETEETLLKTIEKYKFAIAESNEKLKAIKQIILDE